MNGVGELWTTMRVTAQGGGGVEVLGVSVWAMMLPWPGSIEGERDWEVMQLSMTWVESGVGEIRAIKGSVMVQLGKVEIHELWPKI